MFGTSQVSESKMTDRIIRLVTLFVIVVLAVACGTAVTPIFEEAEEEVIAVEATTDDTEAHVAEVPTATAIPPTATPTTAPTEIPTEEPSATPTEEVAQAPQDPIARLVARRDAAHGEELFNTVKDSTGTYSCSTCHNVDNPDKKIGPSLLGISVHGAHHAGDLAIERYLYNSIVNPDEFIVPDYPASLMPQDWHTVLSDNDIYDIIAYLMTIPEA